MFLLHFCAKSRSAPQLGFPGRTLIRVPSLSSLSAFQHQPGPNRTAKVTQEYPKVSSSNDNAEQAHQYISFTRGQAVTSVLLVTVSLDKMMLHFCAVPDSVSWQMATPQMTLSFTGVGVIRLWPVWRGLSSHSSPSWSIVWSPGMSSLPQVSPVSPHALCKDTGCLGHIAVIMKYFAADSQCSVTQKRTIISHSSSSVPLSLYLEGMDKLWWLGRNSWPGDTLCACYWEVKRLRLNLTNHCLIT